MAWHASSPPALAQVQHYENIWGPQPHKKTAPEDPKTPQKFQIPNPIFCNEGLSTVLCDKYQNNSMSAANRLRPYSATKFHHEKILL